MRHSALLIALLFPLMSAAQFGTLDNNFDADGFLTYDVGSSSYTTGYDVAIQADGKILLLGTTNTPLGLAPYVIRLFPDGSSDLSFGVNGGSALIVNNAEYDARQMLVQPDGKLVLVGGGVNDGVSGVVVMRLNGVDGFLDATFGTDGVVHIPYPEDSYLFDLAIQPDGKIVAVGYSTESDIDLLAVRLNADGTLDNTFSFDGKVVTDINDGDGGQAVVIGNDGKITVAGISFTESGSDALLVRYNTDGTLDSTFGANGIVLHEFSSGNSDLQDIVLTATGSMYACGLAEGTGDNDFLVAKFNTDGTLDNTFAMHGFDRMDIANSDDLANELLVQPDGRILAVGYSSVAGDYSSAMLRYNTNGLLDPTFGNLGQVVTSTFDDESLLEAVTLQADLKIVVAGSSQAGMTNKGLVARYLSGMNVGIGEVSASIGSTFVYPNPITNNSITIEYELKTDERVSIDLLDVTGKRIGVLQQELEESANRYQKTLQLPVVNSGSYLLRLNTLNGSVTVKLNVI